MAAPLSLWNISGAWMRHRLARSVVGFAAWLVRVLRCSFVRAADAVRGFASSPWPWSGWLGGGGGYASESCRHSAPVSFATESLLAIADALAAVGRQFGSLISSKSTLDHASSVSPQISQQRPSHATTALRALFDLLRSVLRAVFGLLWRRRGAVFRGALILALSLSAAHRARLLVVRSGALRCGSSETSINRTNHSMNRGPIMATHHTYHAFAPHTKDTPVESSRNLMFL
jgi:hypothetical protein